MIRPYTPADHAACLALVPGLILPDHFFVLEHEGRIVGCGGFSNAGELQAGCIDPAFRGHGLGRFLLLHRLREIARLPGVTHATLTPPPGTATFYARQGFKAAGNSGEMALRLQVCP